MKTPIPFRGFDEQGEVRIYQHGVLPHWRQQGCTYFVTFRLADSIPRHVLLDIETRRTQWLKSRGIDALQGAWKDQLAKLSSEENRAYEKLVGLLINQSLDECHGACILRNSAIGRIVANALDHFHCSRVFTGDFVIMPNHVHVLLTPLAQFELEDIMHSIKSYTANEINSILNKSGQLWQRESYDHIVRDIDQLQAYQYYIRMNPVKAKLRNGEYMLSHAEYTVVDR